MVDVSLHAPAHFSAPVLYDVEVTLDGRLLYPHERRETVRRALALCSVDMVLVGSGGELIDHSAAVSLQRDDPCRPWSWASGCS